MINIIYTKVSSKICQKNRTFYKNRVKRQFVMWCAYEGLFDGVFTKTEIKLAKKGYLPADCNIHHKIPLSGGEGEYLNDFDNLSIIHKNTHEYINKHIYSPQIKVINSMPEGSQIRIKIPDFSFVDRDGIKSERNKQKLLTRQKRGKSYE